MSPIADPPVEGTSGGRGELGESFMRALSFVLLGVGTIIVGAVSCTKLPGEPHAYDGLGGRPIVLVPTGQGVGEACSLTDPCRPGLDCVDDVCVPGMSLGEGERCLIGPECEDEEIPLICQAGFCTPAGDGVLGDACETDVDCEKGLRCSIVDLALKCAPAGTGDYEQPCESQSDCFQGLYCSEGKCSLPEAPYGVPVWSGATCPKNDAEGAVALFNVPGAKDTPSSADFFSLPYPNDVRLNADGRPNLEGFPTPGAALLGVDMVKRYVDAVEEHAHGFSTNPSVIFRFSGEVKFSTLAFESGKRPVVWVDLDDPTSTLSSIGVSWQANAGGGSYVCNNWMAVNSGLGGTLVPGHSYAVWLTTDARTSKDEPVKRSSQFAAMLANSAPSDAKLATAYTKYAKLRSYLSARSIDPATILNATVFTTDDPVQPMRDLAAQVAAADLPEATEWVKCATGVESPCPQADESEGRACGNGGAQYDEYHALVELPIFQEGDAPYKDTGGGISDEVVRTEKVCLSLTVPKATMPAAGWPLVVYGHGTGGSFRSHVRDEVAGALARATPKFAVVGIDQVEHGSRRGDSKESPNNLFFNFTNPDAARGNPMQGAADQLSLLRLLPTLDLTSAQSGGSAIKIDGTKVVLYGHSQGSTHGSLALPLSAFPGAVLSGNGGNLAQALLNKSSPENIAAGIPIALQDPVNVDGEVKLRMGADHPALGVLQQYIDPADPLNFAPLLFRRPEPSQPLKHVFQTFGLSDTYSPASTMAAYIYAANGMTLAEAPSNFTTEGVERLNMTQATAPVSGNITVDTQTVTAVCRQYEPPAGEDGHYVVFDVDAAVDDVVAFLEALASGTQPTIPAP